MIEPLDRESFDLEFSPTGQLIRETHYTFGGNTHHSQRLFYDELGRHVRSVSHDPTGQEAESTEYDYDKSDREISSTTYDMNKQVLHRSVCIFSEDKVSTELFYEANSVLRRQKDYQYERGKLARTVSRYLNPDGTVREKRIAAFDSEGRALLSYGLTGAGKPLGDGKYLHEYDAEGRESRKLNLDEFDAEKPAKCEELSEYSSDEQGNWIERRSRSKWLGDSDWTETITVRTIEYYS